VRTLHRSGDCWRGSDGVGIGRDVLMDWEVSRGRKNGWVCENEELSLSSEVFLPVDFWEEDEGSAKEGLEEFSWDTSLKELPELSQHEELQDLELHGGKAV